MTEFGHALDFQRKAVFVDDVPVKDIHFVVEQGVDLLPDRGHWQEMPRRVNHNSPPLEFRLVLDADGDSFDRVFPIGADLKHLRKGLKPPQKTCVVLGT